MKILIKHWTSLFILALFISCNNKVYKGLWQTQPTQVNGVSKELPRSYKFYDSESSLYYTIGNDLDNLYISIATNSPQTQMRILRSGIQFCIDTTGKFGEHTKIVFPFAVMQKKNKSFSDEENIPNQSGGQGRSRGLGQKPESLNSLKKKFMNENKAMHLIGFRTPIGGTVPLPNDYGIKMDITWDSANTMIYQASIPFVTFYKKSLSIADSSKIVGISMSLTGLPNAQAPGGMRPMGGMGGGGMSLGMGGMGGMGMGIGMRIPIGGSGNGMGRQANQPNTTIKMKIKLAKKPES